MPYYELEISIPGTLRDAVIKKLNDFGCLGAIEEEDRIRAYFPESADMASIEKELSIVRSLLEASSHPGRFQVVRTLVPDQDWNETWKKGFHAIDVGSRFTILPPWEDERRGRINLIIDPAMAFGTGHHETTRSCLLLMEKYAEQGRKEFFLDIGTGTGILAIAAAKLGFQSVIGVDTDPLAVEAARENIKINGTPDIRIMGGSLAELIDRYDFIVANIISGVLVMLASAIAAHLKPEGFCVLSGILQGQEEEVIHAMSDAGLKLIEEYPDGKWMSLVVKN